ncbi:MAG: pSer/pThr/pTyr-binding forkhead associated (FHA) protein [Planctomycetota bacterium]|jgi:pSer/pThr/pTyr-binding forkhead associated (FHA) protein
MAKIIVNDGEGESEFALPESGATIGRVAKQCEIVIKVPEASRQHCRVKLDGGSWFVEDLGSSNGTKVNGRKVTTFELQDGDEITVGKASLRFLESEVELDEISLEDDDDVELEISLEEDAYLRFLNTDRKGEKVAFAGRMTFGRRSSNSVKLDEKGVSGNHSEFIPESGDWIARDLGSTNGTLVNGEPAVEAHLAAGDRVRIGTVEFVFGLGDNEGDGALVATAIMEEVPLEEEIFAISEANMKRKQKTATVLWLVFIVAIGGAGGWWLTQGVSSSSKTEKTQVIAGNQLGTDGNFEIREDDSDYLATESDAVDYVETTKKKASGERGLEVKVTDGDGDHYLVFTREIENISTADRIEVGGKIRTSGATGGGVGFSLIWKDSAGRTIGTSEANAPMGEGKFQEIRSLFMPPLGTEKAAVAIGFHDASGKVVVDDVFALRSRGGGSTLTAHGHDLHLDDSGSLVVSRDGTEILDQGGLYRLEGGSPKFLGRFFATEEVEGNEQARAISGYLSLNDGGASKFAATVTGNGVEWSGSMEEAADTTAGFDLGDVRFENRALAPEFKKTSKVILGFRIDPTEGLVTVGAEGAQRHAEDFVRSGVTELVIATGPRALRMSFADATSVVMLTHGRESFVLLPLMTTESRRGFSQKIQLNFDAELGEVNALNDKARDADIVRKQFGEAMGYYKEIVNRYSFRKDISDRAASRLAQLGTKAENALARLNKDVDEVLFFRTFNEERARLDEELDGMITGYSKSAFEPQFVATKGRLGDAWAEVSGTRRSMLAQNHLIRGRDLMEPGNSAPILARGFFLSVIRLAPDSEFAKTAGAELEKIKSLLGSQ